MPIPSSAPTTSPGSSGLSERVCSQPVAAAQNLPSAGPPADVSRQSSLNLALVSMRAIVPDEPTFTGCR